ncbi:zinc finger protein 398-like protein [Platysternon megacephalum]|uniref:Zinc finger protein 398-like protein n=1 Tax=Platysternon megacephalum TaxID=55544 RepID=A0A4D9EDD9_9SAUR|nr:zinc finger protein 398-like protein [Platysternon megacephalum]
MNQEEDPGCGGRGDSGENEISGIPCSEFQIVPPDAVSWVKREEEPCGQDRPVSGEGRTPAGPSPESPAPAPARSPLVKPEPEACAGTQPALEQRGLPGEPSAAAGRIVIKAEERQVEEKPEILELTMTLLGRADEEAFQSQDQPVESPRGRKSFTLQQHSATAARKPALRHPRRAEPAGDVPAGGASGQETVRTNKTAAAA